LVETFIHMARGLVTAAAPVDVDLGKHCLLLASKQTQALYFRQSTGIDRRKFGQVCAAHPSPLHRFAARIAAFERALFFCHRASQPPGR
jgi:hypothetical protein